MDALLVHKNIAEKLFKNLVKKFQTKRVELFADDISYAILKKLGYRYLQKVTKDDYEKEFLSLKMAIKSVGSISETIKHINKIY